MLKSPELRQIGALLAQKPLKLQDAIAVSLAISRPLAAAQANLYAAQGRVAEAQSALNPTVVAVLDSVHHQGSTNSKVLNSNDPIDFNMPIGRTVVTQHEQEEFIGVQASLPFDIGGAIRAATDSAKFLEIDFALDVQRTRNLVVSGVKTAFYDVLRAQALVHVADENLKNTQERLKDAENRLAARVVTRFDVLRAQTDVANARQQRILARNQVKLATAALNRAIGLEVDAPLTLSDADAVAVPPGVAPPNAANMPPAVIEPNEADGLGPEFKPLLKEALQLRPEIWQAEALTAAARRNIVVARRSALPGASLNFGYLYAPNAGGSTPQNLTWQFTAALTLPLYDGGLARSRVKEARGMVALYQTQQRDTQDQVTQEAETAYLNLLQSRDRVEVANQAVSQAQEAFRLAQVRYKEGVSARAGISPLLELSDAQNALTLAQSNQVNALYDYNTSRALLDRSLGRYAVPLRLEVEKKLAAGSH